MAGRAGTGATSIRGEPSALSMLCWTVSAAPLQVWMSSRGPRGLIGGCCDGPCAPGFFCQGRHGRAKTPLLGPFFLCIRAGDVVRARKARNLVANPGSDAARAYLQDRFGISGNVTEGQNMRDVGVSRTGVLYPHKTTVPNMVIPKQVREMP